MWFILTSKPRLRYRREKKNKKQTHLHQSLCGRGQARTQRRERVREGEEMH